MICCLVVAETAVVVVVIIIIIVVVVVVVVVVIRKGISDSRACRSPASSYYYSRPPGMQAAFITFSPTAWVVAVATTTLILTNTPERRGVVGLLRSSLEIPLSTIVSRLV